MKIKIMALVFWSFLVACSSDNDDTSEELYFDFELTEIYSISQNRAFAKIQTNQSEAVFELRLSKTQDNDLFTDLWYEVTPNQINYLCDLDSVSTYEATLIATFNDQEIEGNSLIFETGQGGTDNSTEVVEITNPVTGRIWMDRNLGAERVAIAGNDRRSYGHLYQWGRRADGHQLRDASITESQATNIQPQHDLFIAGFPTWNNQQNTDLWQGVDAANNPCPCGFRLPSPEELAEEISSWTTADAAGAFESSMKFSLPGYRGNADGEIASEGNFGYYWSAESENMNGKDMGINTFSAQVTSHLQGGGASVRCIKDE